MAWNRNMDEAPRDGTRFMAYVRHNEGGAEVVTFASAPPRYSAEEWAHTPGGTLRRT